MHGHSNVCTYIARSFFGQASTIMAEVITSTKKQHFIYLGYFTCSIVFSKKCSDLRALSSGHLQLVMHVHIISLPSIMLSALQLACSLLLVYDSVF